MSSPLSCYYLDEPLDDDELAFVRQALIGPWAKFKTGASDLAQKRVPGVLPTPDAQCGYAQDREQRAEGVRRNLRHAGIRADRGRQVLWVMPRDAEWDAIFRYAIQEETGVAPLVAQRWFAQESGLVPGPLRVVDTRMLLEGL